jgi:hypothetical protein
VRDTTILRELYNIFTEDGFVSDEQDLFIGYIHDDCVENFIV